MSRRMVLLVRTLVVLSLVVLLLVVLSLSWPGVGSSNFERIERDMTLSEVESLLGGPGKRGHFNATRWDDGGPDPSTWIWHSDAVTITVKLDRESKLVRSKDYDGPAEDSYLFYFRSLLPWNW